MNFIGRGHSVYGTLRWFVGFNSGTTALVTVSEQTPRISWPCVTAIFVGRVSAQIRRFLNSWYWGRACLILYHVHSSIRMLVFATTCTIKNSPWSHWLLSWCHLLGGRILPLRKFRRLFAPRHGLLNHLRLSDHPDGWCLLSARHYSCRRPFGMPINMVWKWLLLNSRP